MVECLPDIFEALTKLGYNAEENVSVRKVVYFFVYDPRPHIAFKVYVQDKYVGEWDPILRRFKN